MISSYALDGAPAAEATSSATPGDTFNQLFWASPTFVTAGDQYVFIVWNKLFYMNFHSQLVVKMVKVNPNDQSGEGTIWFDYFSVTGVPQDATAVPSPQKVTSPQKKTNVGAIVGGVVGGSSILILLLLLLFFYRRRRLSKDIPVDPCKSPHLQIFYFSCFLQFQSTPTMSRQTQIFILRQ